MGKKHHLVLSLFLSHFLYCERKKRIQKKRIAMTIGVITVITAPAKE